MLGKSRSGKGQAAVEFLTTYGWALLVIVIVLVVLGWLGVFSAQGRVQDRCDFQQGLECNDARIALGVGSVSGGRPITVNSLVLTNRLPYTIYICGGTACSTSPTETVSRAQCAGGTGGSTGGSIPLQPGERKEILAGVGKPLCTEGTGAAKKTIMGEVGDRFAGRLLVPYSLVDDANTGTKARVFTGEIVANVQP